MERRKFYAAKSHCWLDWWFSLKWMRALKGVVEITSDTSEKKGFKSINRMRQPSNWSLIELFLLAFIESSSIIKIYVCCAASNFHTREILRQETAWISSADAMWKSSHEVLCKWKKNNKKENSLRHHCPDLEQAEKLFTSRWRKTI